MSNDGTENTPATQENVTYISREDFEQAAEANLPALHEETLHTLAHQKGDRLRVPRNKAVSRKQVVSAFQSAFDLIGGVPRLAIWADENPSEFYKLYGKLLPSQNSDALGEKNEMIIKHVLPRSRLDG